MVSLQNAIVHQPSQILFYEAEGFIERENSGMKCDSVLFTCHDGQDQWTEKSLFFIQLSAMVSDHGDWWAHDDHMDKLWWHE